MAFMQHFADLNRTVIKEVILDGMKLTEEDSFTTIHNYIDTEAMILRKGAVSAKSGERLLIPMNMRDGSLLCTGLGNEEWNCSAPHGAGRLMSRREAFDSFTLGEFEKSMEGIYSTSVTRDTLDESPMVYKPIEEIMQGIKDTATIDCIWTWNGDLNDVFRQSQKTRNFLRPGAVSSRKPHLLSFEWRTSSRQHSTDVTVTMIT